MTALAANRNLVRQAQAELRGFDVAAGEHIYRNALVGLSVAGYLKAFEPCDLLVGVADGEADNSSGVAGDTAMTAGKHGRCNVWVAGEFEHALSGAAQGDGGRAVYATDDATLSFTGHPDAFVGRVMRYISSGVALIRLKEPGERPGPNDFGSIEIAEAWPTLASMASGGSQRMLDYVAANGSGIECSDPGALVAFDAVSEAAQASIETGEIFPVAGGITYECELYATTLVAAALDLDFGLGTALTSNTRPDLDHADTVDLACFHMDGTTSSLALIEVQSDNDVTDTGQVDTGLVNAVAVAKKFRINVRPDGTAEFYVDGVAVATATSFAVGAAKTLAAFINLEKSSDAAAAAVEVKNLRVCGAAS